MLLGTLLLVQAALSLRLGMLVISADRSRWDHRLFAAMMGLDVLSMGARGVLILSGGSLIDPVVASTRAALGLPMLCVTALFVASFPRGQPPPRWLLNLLPLAVLTAVLRAWGVDWEVPRYRPLVVLYALGFLVLTIGLAWRNRRREPDPRARSGITWLLAAVVWRIGCAVVVVRGSRYRHLFPEVHDAALLFEATVVPLVADVIAALAILRYQLFTVRGVLAELLLLAGQVAATVGLTIVAVDLVLAHVPSEAARHALLVAVALIPLALVWAGRTVRVRLLERLDPRQTRRRMAIERLAQGATIDGGLPAQIREVTQVMGALSGGEAAFLAGPEVVDPEGCERLPPHVIEELRQGPTPGPGDATLVPVQRGATLYGALALRGGEVDRSTLSVGSIAAQHLATQLEASALAARTSRMRSELEDSRHLAALGTLAAAVAHDLRTPLTSVKLNVQILRRKVRLEPDDMEHFDITDEALSRLSGYVSDLLEFAKPVQLDKARLDLRDVLQEAAVEAARGVVPATIRLETEGGSAPAVDGDRRRLVQALLNLISNAVQASHPGGTVQVVSCALEDGRPAIEVRDTGRGIDPAQLGQIFEPFFTTRAEGTGLGLPMVRRLVMAHGGEVLVSSTPGAGTTVTIALPSA